MKGIGCPECGKGLGEPFLRAILTKGQTVRLLRQSLESAVGSCAGLKPCPTPDCPNRVVLEGGVEPRLTCEMCHKELCLLCSASPYHVGKSCEEHATQLKDKTSEASLRQWITKVGAKQSPKCRAAVTKHNLEGQTTQNSECHKMICRSYRTKFCFACLAILTDSSTCGCTPDAHGFIDPDTGSFVRHLRPVRAPPRGRETASVRGRTSVRSRPPSAD